MLTRASVDRTKYSRMGWSDISISLSGPIVNSTILHFVDRWFVSQFCNNILLTYFRLTDGAVGTTFSDKSTTLTTTPANTRNSNSLCNTRLHLRVSSTRVKEMVRRCPSEGSNVILPANLDGYGERRVRRSGKRVPSIATAPTFRCAEGESDTPRSFANLGS